MVFSICIGQTIEQTAMVVVLAGCTHFIIGRDMAGSKSSVSGEDFYGAYDAQETAAKHAEELHMQTVPSLNITYTEVGHPTPLIN